MIDAAGRAMSFRAQLSLTMGAVLVLVLSFVAIYFPARLEREAIALVSYKMRALLDLTSFTIYPALSLGDVDAVDEALTGTKRDADVVYIIVTGPRDIIAAVNRDRASASALRRSLDGDSISEDGSLYEGMATIRDGDEAIARLYVGMSLQRVRREIRNARFAVALVSAVVLAVGLVGVIGMATFLTRPLRNVAAAAKTIASGDLRERVRIAGSAEVRQLSSSFNRMVQEIQMRASELQRSHDELSRLSKKLLSVQEEERVTISREVHDEVGAALTVLKMDIQELPPQRIHPEAAAHLTDSVDSLIELVRRIATELRPMILDDLGLRAAIEQQVRRLGEKSGISATLEAPDVLDVDRLTASTILRIVQEALSNVVRHSQASAVAVRLRMDDRIIEVEIHDNGRGIALEKISSPTSLGLVGIRERVLLLAGRVTIERTEPKGTRIRIVLPSAAAVMES